MDNIGWAFRLKEKQKKKLPCIILYKDEHDESSWEEYCNIVGVSPITEVLELYVCGLRTANEEMGVI